MVSLNRAVAVGMVSGPAAGLAALAELERRRWPTTTASHAVRAHLLLDLGDRAARPRGLPRRGRPTTSAPERAYLESRAVVFNIKGQAR